MKILMIGAHQDDNEFRCGGITAKLVAKGHDVRFLSMCNGSGGHHIMTPEETVKRRAGESAKVAEMLGITYDVWDNNDCTLVADIETRRKLIRYIRNYNPDVIISHRENDYHADHRAVGTLVQDASYMLIVPQVYEWLPYTHHETVPEGKEERFEWLKGMNITEDTTDQEVMAAKRGYAVRFAKTAARFRKELTEKYGEEKGNKIRYAEAFGISPYGGVLTEEIRKELFE